MPATAGRSRESHALTWCSRLTIPPALYWSKSTATAGRRPRTKKPPTITPGKIAPLRGWPKSVRGYSIRTSSPQTKAGREMQFEFATAGRILFGAGTVRQAAPAAKEFGRRALLVMGRSPDRVQSLAKALNGASVSCTLFPVESEPTVEMIARGLEAARREECDFVVSFGGGSVIDAGKVCAFHRHSDDGRHGFRGHAQRRSGLARTSGEGKLAKSADVAQARHCRPRADFQLATHRDRPERL